MEKFSNFARIAEIEYSDIVLSAQDLGTKLRIYLVDKSFVDFFYTTKLKSQRFSLHWERSFIDATIYRIDNTPDSKWQHVSTFPIHFHNKIYGQVIHPPFTVEHTIVLEKIFRDLFQFVKENIA